MFNKLFRKVSMAVVGIAMAIGVGVAIGIGSSKEVEPVHAAVSSTATASLDSDCTHNNSGIPTSATSGWKASTAASNYESSNSARGWAWTNGTDATITYFSSGTTFGKVSVIASTNSGASKVSLVVKVGGTTWTPSSTYVSTTANQTYDFTGSNSGNVVLEFTNTGSKSTWIKDISIYAEDSTIPSLSSITSSPAKHTLSVGNSTGLTLSTTPTNAGDNTVGWSVSPSTGVNLSTTSGNSTVVTFPSGANALTGGTEVTVTASLTGADSQTYTICAIANDGTLANPYTAVEAKYLTIEGDTSSHYVGGYISSTPAAKYFWIDNTASSEQTFEIYNSSGLSNSYLQKGRFVVAHGTFAYYNSTTSEMTGAIIDRVDYITLESSELEVNNTRTTTLSVSAAGGDVEWSTTDGTGSVSLSSGSNSSVTITGTSVGTATVTATVGSASANCTVTVLQYATDWTFVSIVIETSAGFIDTYQQGATFDKTGIAVNYTEHSDTLGKNRTIDRVNDATFNFDANKNTVGQFNLTATYGGHTSSNTVTITITKAPGRIDFGSASGNYNFTTDYSENPFEDNLGSVVTRDITTAGNTSATQIGGSGKASTVIVTITFGERKGVEGVTVNLATSQAAGTVSVSVYGDTTNDAILSDSVTGNSAQSVTVSNSYETINANAIHVKLEGTTGICLKYISYYVGDTVQEFDTASFTSLTIKTPATDTVFKVGQKFSTAGLVLTATDGFEKDFSSGFTTTFDANKTSAFEEGDVGNNKTVTVSLTIGSTTKTVSYEINVIDPPTYSLADDLYEGMKVILVESGGTAVGAYGTNQYAVVTDTTVSAGVVTDASTALEFTVRIFGESFGLQYGDKYLSYSGSSNEAYQSSTLNANASWKHDGTGLLWCGNESAGRYFQINGVLKAACYTSTQKHLSLYVSSASTKTDPLAADTFTYRYLHMRDYLGTEGEAGSNYCKNTGDGAGKNYFSDAATAYASLSAAVKTEFKKNTDAVKRFQAWALANEKSIDLDSGIVTPAQNQKIVAGVFGSDSTNTSLVVVIISLAGLSAAGGYFFLRHRREEN